jgi:ribonuclease E
MLIDAAHPEETRVVVLNGNRLEEFDFESSTKKQVKGNIYLAKVTRVEPSLQAAFVDYGGNRHGFLAFSEIHPDYYRIPVSDREADEYDAPSAGVAEAFASAGGDEGPEYVAEPAPERDETPNAIADALPEAAPVAEAESDEDGDAEPAPIAEPENEAPSGEVNDVEMAAPIESVVSSDPFFESTEPAVAEDVATLDDEEEAEERETERRRSYSSRHYKIQEVVKRRQIMLVQVAKEERGNKGAALTTYLSLAGRYCVLMPNTGRGGGVSRKITSLADRRRLKEILEDLGIPEGMGVIVRTAGSERSKAEIKRDYEYMMRLWSEIRDLTLKSTAPALIYEEGNLIKRSIRDLYARDIDEVVVEGEEGYRTAKDFMRMLMPSHARRVQPYRDPQIGLFHKYQVESQIDAVHSPVAQLRSGGYLVINQTEALVSIDVNSGRATRERNIEETALKTNLEASDEIARQLRLRDLAGLIVIDFIDMEEHRHNSAVERRLKDALRNDRARIQVGRISAFGLMEMSRQRLRPSLAEASTQPCPHCGGVGFVRSTESTALHVLRAIEEEGARGRSAEICIYVPTGVALYILNQKRESLGQIEARYGLRVTLGRDDTLIQPNFRLERLRAYAAGEAPTPRLVTPPPIEIDDDDEDMIEIEDDAEAPPRAAAEAGATRSRERGDDERGSRRRRRRRGRRGEERAEPRRDEGTAPARAEESAPAEEDHDEQQRPAAAEGAARDADGGRRRRRGRRGGRWRNRENGEAKPETAGDVDGEVPGEAAEAVVEAAIESAEIPPFEGREEPVPIAAEAAAPSVDELAADEIVEAAIESAEIPPIEGHEEPAPLVAEAEAPAIELLVEAAIESAEIPFVEEPTVEPERILETVGAGGNGADSEPEPARRAPRQRPEGVDVHAVTEKPSSPRRGWWTRLIQ